MINTFLVLKLNKTQIFIETKIFNTRITLCTPLVLNTNTV